MARAKALFAAVALLFQVALAASVCSNGTQPRPHCQSASGHHCCCAQKAKDCACSIGAPARPDQQQAGAQLPAPTVAAHASLALLVGPLRPIERGEPQRAEDPKPKAHHRPPDQGRAPPVA